MTILTLVSFISSRLIRTYKIQTISYLLSINVQCHLGQSNTKEIIKWILAHGPPYLRI